VARMGRKGHTWKALVEKHEAKRKSGRRHDKRGCNITATIKETNCCVVVQRVEK
jgi:hypothetical protein